MLHNPATFTMDSRCDVSDAKTSWLVDCSYRAANAFGALVQQRSRFWVKNERIIKAE